MKKYIKKYLIPHEENEYQPHILRRKSTLFFLFLILLFELISLVILTPTKTGKFFNLATVFPSVLVSKTNEERKDLGENELIVNDKLVLAAQLKANDMAQNSYFAHTSPDGKDPWYWLNIAGYSHKNAGENLAVNFVDSSDVHKSWMNSPAHKENIIRKGFTEIGIATAEGTYKGKKAIFVAQFFGSPKEVLINPISIEKEFNEEVVQKEPASIAKAEEDAVISDSETLVLGIEKIENEEIISEKITDKKTNTEEIISSANVKPIKSNVSFFEKIVSSPKTTITYIFCLIGFIILLSIFLKVFIKVKIQFPKLILNGIIILFIIIFLIGINYSLVARFSEIL